MCNIQIYHTFLASLAYSIYIKYQVNCISFEILKFKAILTLDFPKRLHIWSFFSVVYIFSIFRIYVTLNRYLLKRLHGQPFTLLFSMMIILRLFFKFSPKMLIDLHSNSFVLTRFNLDTINAGHWFDLKLDRSNLLWDTTFKKLQYFKYFYIIFFGLHLLC